MTHVLDGTRVLDFSENLSGPSCTRLLAEIGAEVIKIEFAPDGDGAREMPYRIDGRSGYFVQQNRGKKSVCLDPTDPRAKAALERLVRTSDVMVENLPVGEIARLGFGWDQVRSLNPKLVMCSISTFGQTGPLAGLPGGNDVASAYTGAAAITGTADGTPVLPQAAFGDVGAGISAAGAIGYLDISAIDVVYEAQSLSAQVLTLGGGKFMPRACGSHHYIGAPLGFFRGKKMVIIIMVMDRAWPGFCRALGREDLIGEPRFADMAARTEHQDELVELIENWIQAQDSDDAALDQLQQAHITCAPVLSVEEAAALPHLIARGVVQTVTDRALGAFIIPGISYRFSEFPRLELDAPFLGEHNAQVLTELAGLTPEQVAEMAADGALVSEPVPEGTAAGE
jgi:crotonobetainyl-CoA:carnitine CoA-transferase CaiB-like acyl-CoA transferase